MNSVCSGHDFPHDPSNTANQLFHTVQDIQSQKKPKCKQTIYFVQTIALFPWAQCHENKRWQLPFLEQRSGWFCHWPKWGSPTAPSRGRWKILPEAHCRHKTQGLMPQKGWMVPCWETLAALDPVLRVWVSPVPAGGAEALPNSYFAFLCNQGDQKISSQL